MKLPDYLGEAGKAWLLIPDNDTCLGAWLVHAPFSHVVWPYKLVALVHLRPSLTMPPAFKRYPEAEYELMVVSINPDVCPQPDPDAWCRGGNEGFPLLYPPDVIEQFHGVSDEQALRIAESAIVSIVNGSLSPDSDWKSHWGKKIKSMTDLFLSGAGLLN